MLNRRILRVKAMQALYAYFTSVESLRELQREKLRSIHALDPAKHDFSDKPLFEKRKKEAVQLFDKYYLDSSLPENQQTGAEVVASVNNAIRSFQEESRKEAKSKLSDMLKEPERIWSSYIKFLSLLQEVEQREKLEKEKEAKAKILRNDYSFPFIDHLVVRRVKSNTSLKGEVEKANVSWDIDQDEIKRWYRELIKRSTVLAPFTSKDDPELVLELYKRVFFKSDTVLTYFASSHLFWEVNQAIIKSMLVKTLKHAAEEEEFPLADITKNGEDDLKFFEMLFTKVINENDFLEDLIQRHTKNWDVERVALTDRILLKLASVEMMYAPSIPVKVSINEVIEISKTHSTPKSKQFVNGVLDVLSNELTSRGKIRKSGRGLIDNK